MSSACSNCGGTGKISNLRVPDPSKHPSAGMGMVKCQICGGSGQLGFDIAGSRQAGELLGELIGEYLPIFVFVFFSANYIPRLIQSYFGLSADVYQNITVVGVLLIIPIIIFRKRLTGRAGWIGAAVLIAAAIFSPDIVTTQEKVVKAMSQPDIELYSAAVVAAKSEQRIARKDQPGSYLQRDDLKLLQGRIRVFTDLFASVSNETATRFCGAEGYLDVASNGQTIVAFDNACESRGF